MSGPFRLRLLVVVALPLLACPLYLRADEAAPAPAAAAKVKQAAMANGYLRFVDNGAAGGRLETSDVTYRNADGVTVRLVSAVHIGEKSYYEGLSRSFDDDEAVLYELVKPKDAVLAGPGAKPESGSGVGQIQRMMKDVLNLEFQLDAIDYGRTNFVHADLDAESFKKLQEERGETFEMLFLKGLMDAMRKAPEEAQAQDAKGEDMEQSLREMIRLVTRPDMERQLKLVIARHMTDIEAGAAAFGDPKNNVIVTERNKAAVKVLSDTIARGKKKISVFYGAAHMPDFAERLAAMGFKPVATQWRMAWDLTIRQDQPSAIEELIVEGIKALSEE